MIHNEEPPNDPGKERKTYEIKLYLMRIDDEGIPRSKERVTSMRTNDPRVRKDKLYSKDDARRYANELVSHPEDVTKNPEVKRAINRANHKKKGRDKIDIEIYEVD